MSLGKRAWMAILAGLLLWVALFLSWLWYGQPALVSAASDWFLSDHAPLIQAGPTKLGYYPISPRWPSDRNGSPVDGASEAQIDQGTDKRIRGMLMMTKSNADAEWTPLAVTNFG
jgi:hypothetical protein